MNAHELRTSLEKAENSQFELRPRFAKRTTLAGPLNRGGLGKSIFPPYQSLTSISQQKLNFLKWPSHTTIVDWSSAGVAQSGLDAAGSTPVRLEPSSLGMQNPVAICQDSVSCPVYFTAPCNHFSLKAFHNISDKVNFLFHLARPTHKVKGPLPSLPLNHPPLIPVKLCTFYAFNVNCRTISLPATNKILCTLMHLSALIRKTRRNSSKCPKNIKTRKNTFLFFRAGRDPQSRPFPLCSNFTTLGPGRYANR